MRIGMITGEYPPMQGGVGAYTRILSGEIASYEHQVFIFTAAAGQNPDQQPPQDALHLTATVTHWGLGSLRAARRWTRANHLDLVNIQYQTAAYAMSPYIHFLPEALRPIPVVTTFHDLRFPYLFPKAGKLRDHIVQRLANASAGVIATNHEDFARLRHPCAALIPIGSNISRQPDTDTAAFRALAGAAPEDLLIVYFGLVNHSKGLDTLLDALALLPDLPLRLALVGAVAGSSDPTNTAYLREIDAQIDRLNLAPRVHRTGYLDDAAVSGYLHAADFVALPFRDGASYRRGTLMAAIQHGAAILTTTPQVAVPSFTDGENLCLVPPDDPHTLAQAIRALYQSPAQRKALRTGAQALAHEFEWNKIARSTLVLYARIPGVFA